MGHLALDFSSLSPEMEAIGRTLPWGQEFSHGLKSWMHVYHLSGRSGLTP